MKNLAIFDKLVTEYNKKAFTNNYIFGFVYAGNIWAVETTHELLPIISKLDKASKGGGYSLRFKPDKSQKLVLMAHQPRLICSKEYFEDMVKNSIYNKGEVFEKMITESFGIKWEKDHIPFWVDGDLEVNGKAYQIKFEKATFTNEKTLARLA